MSVPACVPSCLHQARAPSCTHHAHAYPRVYTSVHPSAYTKITNAGGAHGQHHRGLMAVWDAATMGAPSHAHEAPKGAPSIPSSEGRQIRAMHVVIKAAGKAGKKTG
jgi:hypothetical protein